MFSNGTRLGLVSKKKKRQDKAAQKLLLCRFALFCFAVDEEKKKIDCLLLNSRIPGKYYANKRKMITDP